MTGSLDDFPARVRGRSAPPETWYRRLPGWFALHGGIRSPGSLEVVESLDDGSILVCRGAPPADVVAGLVAGPVYALEPDGPPAVPTGLVLVRLREPEPASARREDFAVAGYEIHEALPFAPHAAWLRAPGGDLLAALAGLDALAALSRVENVEPQMLSAAPRRA